jgi:hypothetical protein
MSINRAITCFYQYFSYHVRKEFIAMNINVDLDIEFYVFTLFDISWINRVGYKFHRHVCFKFVNVFIFFNDCSIDLLTIHVIFEDKEMYINDCLQYGLRISGFLNYP